MQIGDKIRFLNDVGGGIIKGFSKKDYVIVADEEGFEIPVPAKECVVIEEYQKPVETPEMKIQREIDAKAEKLRAEQKRKEDEEKEMLRALKDKFMTDVSRNNVTKKNVANNTPDEDSQLIKERAFGILEVDLHAGELLETTAGMGNTEILLYQLSKFNEVMTTYLPKKGTRIVFIHGKGEGVLRNAVIKELKTKYPQCYYQDASFREYGFGATMVTIK